MTPGELRRADRKGNEIIGKALESGNLAVGADQKAVRWVERLLRAAGFDPGTPDSLFDARTQKALRAFQRSRGLEPSGALDAKTFKHLNVVLERVRKHHKAKVFGRGQKDAYIAAAEQRLKKLGYDVGKVDGVFDAKTVEALAAFKKDEGRKGAAVLTEGLMKGLRQEVKGLEHVPYRTRVKKDLEAHKRLDAHTAKQAAQKYEVPVFNADGTPKLDAEGNPVTKEVLGLGVGSTGRAVKNIQWHLRLAGFDPGRQDGVFDGRTEAALLAFQRQSGFKSPTGRVGTGTWKQLAKTAIYARGDATPQQKLWERSAAVKRTEQVLEKLGLNPGKVDGLFDGKTAAAVKRFEKQHGLKVDGTVGANQLKAMRQATRGVTPQQLERIIPRLTLAEARAFTPHLNRAMAEFKINTPKRQAMFIAQIAHETGGFRWFTELSSGKQYEGRSDLGNTQPGDGARFKGRGAIQLTGRYNYTKAGKALGLPLVSKPAMAASNAVSFRIAGWYWASRNLNHYADRSDLRAVTLRINGGYNGLSDRAAYYQRARNVLL